VYDARHGGVIVCWKDVEEWVYALQPGASQLRVLML
jgi:hypothetical protein